MAILTREQVTQDNTPAQSATLGILSSGAAGIAQTLQFMIAYVKQYRKNPDIRRFAENIIRDVPAKDSVSEVRAVFKWVRDNIRYTQDIRDVETLKTPDAVIFSGMGDCDDMSTLVSTLLEAVGYTTRFCAVGVNEPGLYEHVYAQVKLGTRWISLDCTEQYPMGWEAPNQTALMIRHI